MRNKLTILKTTFHQGFFLFVITMLISYVVLSLITIYGITSHDLDQAYIRVVYVMQSIVPICGMFWGAAPLQMWINSDAEEIMRSTSKRRRCSAGAVLAGGVFFALLLVPLISGLFYFFFNIWIEFVRVLIEILIYISVLYFLSVMAHSASLGIVFVTCYHFCSVTFCRYSAINRIFLIQPNLILQSFDSLHVFCAIAIILYAIGIVIEKNIYYHNIKF